MLKNVKLAGDQVMMAYMESVKQRLRAELSEDEINKNYSLECSVTSVVCFRNLDTKEVEDRLTRSF